MSTRFSLKLTKKSKKGSKVGKKGDAGKKQTVFGEVAGSPTKTKISLTHVEAYKDEEPKGLIIKPETLKSSLWEKPAGPDDQQVKYGLTYSGSKLEQEPQVGSILVKKPLQGSNLRWLEELPEATKGEEYEEVPVEEFGEALLRGMGWSGIKDNNQLEDQKKVILPHKKGRNLYSGIGSQGASIKQAPKRFSESTFMPFVRINRQTGERIETKAEYTTPSRSKNSP